MNSPGKYLRTLREEKKLGMEEISAITKIPKRILILLEEDRRDLLPADVFVKGFIRSYCQALQTDPNPALELYYDVNKEQKKETRTKYLNLSTFNHHERESNFKLSHLILIIIFILTLLIAIFALTRDKESPELISQDHYPQMKITPPVTGDNGK